MLIDMPLGVQQGEIEYEPDIDSPLEIANPTPNRKKIKKALQMFLEAKRPLLLLGGGVILAEACDEFVQPAGYLYLDNKSTVMLS